MSSSVKRIPGPAAQGLERALLQASDKVGIVGWLETAKYEDGTPVAYVAAVQEHGSPEQGIPPRPFMRTTIAARQAGWRDVTHKAAQMIVAGKSTVADMLNLIGLKASGDIAKTISEIRQPALAVETVKARLRKKKNGGVVNGAISVTAAKPLVDSGILLNTLTHAVEDK